MKKIALLLAAASVAAAAAPASVYGFHTRTLDGHPADLGSYRGKVALVVNVASKCGYTPQYAGLEKLYEQYKGRGFVILGFPSNDFGGQEPGTAAEIETFCKSKFGVTFPLFEKISVKTGDAQAPLYSYLVSAAGGSAPTWNFSRYLVDKKGHVVKFFPSKVKPDDTELTSAIERTLHS